VEAAAVRLLVAHTRTQVVELARYPSYVVPTLLFPALFFLVLGRDHGRAAATLEMATFAGFAAIGVAFFQFGVGIAVDRASPWESYLRTLAVGARLRLAARVLAATPFAAAAAAAVVGAGLATTEATLTAVGWLELATTLLLGLVPFALLGIALGYLVPGRGALPVANLLYLGLSYAGGLWLPVRRLPAFVAGISPYLPTRTLGDALGAVVRGDLPGLRLWAQLAGYASVFGVAAVLAYRREEGRRFR
jgi:ABC-2 type transport system permease protein